MKQDESAWMLVQRLVDGELTPAEETSARATIAANAELQELERRLRSVTAILQGAAPGVERLHRVELGRESYWGAIERRLEAPGAGVAQAAPISGAEGVVRSGGLRLAWLRWIAPALGVATLALLFLGPSRTPGGGSEAYFVESDQREASSVVFRSESDGVTVHWLN